MHCDGRGITFLFTRRAVKPSHLGGGYKTRMFSFCEESPSRKGGVKLHGYTFHFGCKPAPVWAVDSLRDCYQGFLNHARQEFPLCLMHDRSCAGLVKHPVVRMYFSLITAAFEYHFFSKLPNQPVTLAPHDASPSL